jgi:hypothetical protein
MRLENRQASEGAKENALAVFFHRSAARFLDPLFPTAYAMGYHLPPLRG